MLVNILNIRKCKVLIGVKLLLLDFILLSKGRNHFTKLYTVLLPPPSCNSYTNDHANNPILHYISNFRGQCVCLVAIAVRWSPHDKRLAATNCYNLQTDVTSS
jgi:hypothetical protein